MNNEIVVYLHSGIANRNGKEKSRTSHNMYQSRKIMVSKGSQTQERTMLVHLCLVHSCKVHKQAKLINVVRSQKMVSSEDGEGSN